MKEIDIRDAILRLELKPNTKLTLIGILRLVDWKTWAGPCSAAQLSERLNINDRAIKRALKELVELGLIQRSAQRRGGLQHHRALTVLNIELILKGDSGVTHSHSDTMSPLEKPETSEVTHSHSDIKTPLIEPETSEVTHSHSDTMSPLAVTHGHIRGDIKTPLLDVTHSHPISISIDNQSVESMSEEESNEEQVRLERLLSYGVTPENAEIAITEYMDEESSDRLTAVIALERMAKINHDAKKRNERMRRFR
jgi:DNA-binding IscR family transcriptional regulator